MLYSISGVLRLTAMLRPSQSATVAWNITYYCSAIIYVGPFSCKTLRLLYWNSSMTKRTISLKGWKAIYLGLILCLYAFSGFILKVTLYPKATSFLDVGEVYLICNALVQYACVSFCIVLISRVHSNSINALLTEKRCLFRYLCHEIRSPMTIVDGGLDFLKGMMKPGGVITHDMIDMMEVRSSSQHSTVFNFHSYSSK